MHKKVIFFIFAALLLIGGLIVLFSGGKKKEEEDLLKQNLPNPINNFSDEVDFNKILHVGDIGNTVRRLQIAINTKLDDWHMNVNPVIENGIYDDATEKAINELSYGVYSSFYNNVSINNIKFL